MRTIQYGLVNSAMGQIPCSTERISCFIYRLVLNKNLFQYQSLLVQLSYSRIDKKNVTALLRTFTSFHHRQHLSSKWPHSRQMQSAGSHSAFFPHFLCCRIFGDEWDVLVQRPDAFLVIQPTLPSTEGYHQTSCVSYKFTITSTAIDHSMWSTHKY